MIEQEFERKIREVNETLIEYGWVISPFMIGKDFDKIYKLVLKIKSNETPTKDEKEVYLKEINSVLTDIVFHPLFRAFFVYRAQELKHIKLFSHHLERAILHYYKNDYLSTVLCLLPAIEGCLLSYFGWEYKKGRKPNINQLIVEIEKCRIPTYNPAYKIYSIILSKFLRTWIYSDTSTTDTTFSYLNRHYIMHGMGTGNYYSLSDAHRLIVFFDLLIEFLSIEEKRMYAFIPENKQVTERSQYYFRFIEKNIKRDEILTTESKLLSDNSNYIKEEIIPSWREMVIRAVKEDFEFLKKFKKH